MGRRESRRLDHREKVQELVNSGRKLTPEELSYVKAAYTGIGGLVRSEWSLGQFFTPPEAVEFVHSLVGIKEEPGPMLEPSCGGGAFLEGLDQGLCTAFEPNNETFTVARACYPHATIIRCTVEEMFPPESPSAMDEAFDYCIGNPPFGLGIRWASITGDKKRSMTLPSEQVFVEIAYRAVKPMGRIAMIVPDGLLSNRKSQPFRDWIMRHCYIRAVVSLPTETFFHAGTSVKSSVLYLQKFPTEMQGMDAGDIRDYPIFMAVVEDIGWDSRGRTTKGNDLKEVLLAWERHGNTETQAATDQEHKQQDSPPTEHTKTWQPTLF
jgi:type I restriction enzyme M protein